MDKMAVPNYSGKPFSRPEWEPAPKHRRAAKSISHSKHATSTRAGVEAAEKHVELNTKMDYASSRPQTSKPTRLVEARSETIALDRGPRKEELKEATARQPAKSVGISHHSPTDPRFDVSKITTHHAEGSSQVKKDRAELPPADRKELARQRLEEKRKRLRKNAPA